MELALEVFRNGQEVCRRCAAEVLYHWVCGFDYLVFVYRSRGGIGLRCAREFFDEISVRQFQVIHYCGMGLLKLFVTVFFLIPYIAIRWTGKGQKPVE